MATKLSPALMSEEDDLDVITSSRVLATPNMRVRK